MAIKVTSKKPLAGNRRSHSCKATRHTQKVNLQTMTLADGTRIKTSASEKRTLNKIARTKKANLVG